jgi:hypothetical protein
VLCGYKAQCELLAEQLEVLVAGCEARQQSLICEGTRRRRRRGRGRGTRLALPLLLLHGG